MGLISDAITGALLGRSAYQPPRSIYGSGGPDLDSPEVERLRVLMGGQLQLPSISQSRWYLSDLEKCEHAADAGELGPAARLMRAARRDGRLAGVLSTRTGGLVRLPKRFRGDRQIVTDLELGHEDAGEVRSVFDEMFPPSELAQIAADGVLLGVAVGEFVPVEGRDYPVLVRLDPEFLVYRWVENRWYYRSVVGLIPITPGDGRWFLHTPGGRMAPWQAALWRCIGRAYIRKEHALLHKDNYEAKLANPARVAVAPQGAAEPQKDSWFRQVMAWGVNTVFGMTPGYDVKLIESNGRGWECFDTTITEANTEIIISIAGQTVTVDGGAGFQNSDIHKTIRADLIKDTADGLAYSINTQGIPTFIAYRYGEEAITTMSCVVDYDVTPPKDRNSEAQSLGATAAAIAQLTSALREHEIELDVVALCTRFAVPVTHPTARDADESAPVDQSVALNGAQVTSLLDVISRVVANQLPRDAAVKIIATAFNLDTDTADEMLGSVGAGFVPDPIDDGTGAADDAVDDETDYAADDGVDFAEAA